MFRCARGHLYCMLPGCNLFRILTLQVKNGVCCKWHHPGWMIPFATDSVFIFRHCSNRASENIFFGCISSIFFRVTDVLGISYFCVNPCGTSPRSAVNIMGISKALSPAAITNSGFSFCLRRSIAVPLFRERGTTYTFSPLEKTSAYFILRAAPT